MSDRGPEPDERDVEKVLVLLVGESRVYRMHLENALPVIERLAGDVDDVAVSLLLTSLTTALREPPMLGTPRHLEQLAAAVLRGLRT